VRDPAGRVAFDGDFVLRHLNEPAGPDHFLRSSLAQQLIDKGLLIPYEWVDASTLRSPKLPVVILPCEWTSSQLLAAGKLTLELQSYAVNEGWDLKDASAWNVVFDGLRPVFVDLLSFVPLRAKFWPAAGQFARHFILPLLLDREGGVEARQCFKLWRDGVPSAAARSLLGTRRFLTRYWPLVVGESARNTKSLAQIVIASPADLKKIRNFRSNLQTSLSWMLNGVDPHKRKKISIWANYEDNRSHYSNEALGFKRQVIASWLDEIEPHWVLDVGCNAGELSELAVHTGAKVVCWDSDQQALQKIYLRHSDTETDGNYFPLLCEVDDATGGRGWMGNEFTSLISRLNNQFDVVMLLAITHHLAIAGGVRLEDIFRFVANLGCGAVLLELFSDEDIRVVQLCNQYNRSPSEFSIDNHLKAAAAVGFYPKKHMRQTDGDTRQYVWLGRNTVSDDSVLAKVL
jgi:SAM-dependent methyltransferase